MTFFCDCSFWEIIQHLIWTLLGIADVAPFTSYDSPSNYIAQTLYGVFIISALILLVNMMIAVLSSTYERVEVCYRLCITVVLVKLFYVCFRV